MPSRITREFKTGSKNWIAFLDGRMSASDLLEKEYLGPIAIEVQTALEQTGEYTKSLLADTVTGWSDPPVFVVSARGDVRNLQKAKVELVFLATGSGAEKWGWIDKGTTPHEIPKAGRRPINPMPMRPHTPRTLPGQGLPKSSGSGEHGDPGGYRMKVKNNFIRARKFSERIVEHLKTDGSLGFRARIHAALNRAKRRLKV